MPKRNLRGFGQLIRDLFRELTPMVRSCLFAGLALGFLVGLGYDYSVPADYEIPDAAQHIHQRTVLLPRVAIVLGTTIFGGLIGLASAVSLEWALGSSGEKKSKAWKFPKKHSRRKK